MNEKKQGWTPEPWSVKVKSTNNARRAVTCVNGCRGIPNPDAVKELVAVALKIATTGARDNVPIREVVDDLNAALAKLGVK